MKRNYIDKVIRGLFFGALCTIVLFFASCQEDPEEIVITQPPLDVSVRWGGSVVNIPEGGSFSADPDQTEFTVALGIELSTITLDSFQVDVQKNEEAVQQLISDGTLSDVIALTPDQYSIPDLVDVQAQTISAPLKVRMNFDLLEENPDKKLAFAVTVSNPTLHHLEDGKKTVVVVISTNDAIAASEIGDVTEKYLTNTGYPFTSADREYDGARWGNLDGWEANDAAMSHNGYGGFNSDAGGTFGLESGWGSPNIPNGKVYQVTTLPAGKYAFEVAEWEWDGIKNDPAYFVAALGNGLPDVDNVDDAMSYTILSNGRIEFRLEEESEVSLGVIVNFVEGIGQGFKIKKLTLTRLE